MEPSDEYGPAHAAEAGQFDAAVALANRVFRARRDGDMAREYPALYRRDRLGRLRVITRGGQCVSLVGVVADEVVLLGCSLGVACIGSVCTDEAHRGKGLAGRCLDDAIACAAAGGASLMLISGGRTLYGRRGAFGVGRCDRYTAPAASLGPLPPDCELAEVADASAPAALRLFEAEPIRFRRSEADYRRLLATGSLLNSPGRTCLVTRSGEPAAVLSVNAPRAAGEPCEKVALRECAGARAAVVAAAGAVARQAGAGEVEIDAYPTDAGLRCACVAAGAARETLHMPYALKLLDAERLWSAFGPLLGERLGEAAAGIAVRADADDLRVHTLTFERGPEQVEVAGAHDVMAALFGSCELDPLAGAPGELGEMLRRALPLPLPMYGLNYV